MGRTIVTVYSEEGFLQGFYRGIGSPLVVLTILNMLNFSSYAFFKDKLGIRSEPSNHRLFDVRIFLAGAAAGPLASAISTPSELVKTQMQLSKKTGVAYKNSLQALLTIWKQFGVTALYTGHSVNTLREMVFLGSYFGIYEHSKSYLTAVLHADISIPLAGGLSGAIGWFISFPLDCIKSNMQGVPLRRFSVIDSNRSTMYSTARTLVQKHGLLGLYNGLLPSVVRAFLVSSTRFSAYEFAMWFLS